MTDYPRKPNERAATSGDPIAGARLPRRGGRRAALKFTSAIVVTAAVAVLVAPLRPLLAQPPPVALEVLAAAFSPDRRISIRTKGPSDILQTKIVVQPGGDTGWHSHPGPVIVVVKSGTITEYHENGCVTTHHEGSVFFESEGEVHRAVNDGTIPSEAYATFLIPHGSQPIMPALDPGRVCDPHHDPHHNRDRDDDRGDEDRD